MLSPRVTDCTSPVRKCRPAQMRVSTISSSGAEKLVKFRVSPPNLLLVTPNEVLFPKNICSTRIAAVSSARWPDGCSGYGAVRSGVQDEIAFHGRQKSQKYLSFQQLIAESAAARFIIASRRALPAMSIERPSMRSEATSFQSTAGPPVLCQNRVLCVCVGVRTALVAEPSIVTSFRSAAYAALPSAFGPAVRNCEELCSMNGRTRPTHGVGSSSGRNVVGSISGCQYPGPVSCVHWDGPKRPSFIRAAIIASAAAFPALMPILLNGLSGIAAFAVLYCVVSPANRLALFGNGMVSGTPETMLERTRYAAVAAAASCEAVEPNRLFRRYGR